MAYGERQQAVREQRGHMRSPGRPSVAHREDRVKFWLAIARGASSEEAAIDAGVSGPVGSRWFRQSGGMSSISLVPVSGRYLSFSEREEIAILNAQHVGVRDIARQLTRDPSTISRELRRNSSTRTYSLEYRASTAQWHAERRASRPKVAKLALNQPLRDYVQDRLAGLVTAPDGRQFPGPKVPWGGDTVGAKIVGGRHRGALNRLPSASSLTSPMMRPCEFLTKPSTRLFTCKVVVLSEES